MNFDWDTLVVLDACRYDMFASVYAKYLPGTLKKRRSVAASTCEWLQKTFTGYYDLTYISGNPYCNSTREVKDTFGYRFDAKKHFKKVVDAWDLAWDDSIGSVDPEKLTDLALQHSGKMIVHYMQPHIPYIAKPWVEMKGTPAIIAPEKQAGAVRKTKRLGHLGLRLATAVFGQPFVWEVRHDNSQARNIYTQEGWEGIRKAYSANLEIVLKAAARLVHERSGTVVVTADHGEFLGEHNLFGHPDQPRKNENSEVPWLIVTK